MKRTAVVSATLAIVISAGAYETSFADSEVGSQISSTTTSLSAEQARTLIAEVNPFIKTNSNGQVHVDNGISRLGLNSGQMGFVLSAVQSYNQEVQAGEVNISNHMNVKSVSQLSSVYLYPNSSFSGTSTGEFGLPYSWFHASSPLTVEYQYWWGNQFVLNELATVKTEGALAMLAGGLGISAAAGLVIPFLGEVSGVFLGSFAGYYAVEAGDMQMTDNGAGVNTQFLANWVNISCSANYD